MRSLIASLLLLAGLAIGADVLVTRAAERRVALEVEQSIGGHAQVDLRGWPVSLGLLRGDVDEAAITTTQVPLRRAPGVLPAVHVRLSGVRLRPDSASARSGHFTAHVDQAALTSLTAALGDEAFGDVRLAGDRLLVVVEGVAVNLLVSTRDGAIAVRPENEILNVAAGGERIIPVEGLPPGASLETVEVRDGVLLVSGPLDLATLVNQSS
jgi:DUF2993 family protein